jgi:hypothetical protein
MADAFTASGIDLQSLGSGGGPYTGAPPAAPPTGVSADINALYRGLLPLEWEGVGVPYTRMVLTLRQDLVIHKFADRDGAHIENTGRHPLQFEATIPFINTLGVVRGSETWSQPLYPAQWRRFFQACAIGETGLLQHPELGPLTCKLESVVTVWEGTARGGPTVQVVWIETDDTSTQLLTALGQPSPISAMAAATANLDTYIAGSSRAVIPVLPTFTQTFSQLFAQFQGLGTQFSLLSANVGGQLTAIIYQAQALESALDITPNALNWPIYQSAEQAKDAAYTLQGNLLTTGSNVSTTTISKDSTLAEIAVTLGTDLYLLMNLNPALVAVQPVPSGSLVRFYAS